MAEHQFFPALSGNQQTGAELQLDDVIDIGKTAGLAEDRLLAELLRLPFYGQIVDGLGAAVLAKAIFPYAVSRLTTVGFPPGDCTVQISHSGDNKVVVFPFRAVVGSRTPVATDPIANWRDVRSGLFVGPDVFLQAPVKLVTLSANPGGFARWDLVYATMFVDSNSSPAASRRVKDANSQSVSVQSLTLNLVQVITISVVQGVSAATPLVPDLPADSANVFNFPLAAIRVPAGATLLSTVAAADIRDLAPVGSLAVSTGVSSVRPANGCNDGALGQASIGGYKQFFPWPTGGATRPSVFLPPSMVGSESRLFQVDLNNAATPSLVSGGIVDDSIDWRNRYFKIMVSIGDTNMIRLASDNTNTGPALPSIFSGVGCVAHQMMHSMAPPDASLVPLSSTVCLLTNGTIVAEQGGTFNPIPAGVNVGLYVLRADGILRLYFSGAPGRKFFFWIEASAQFPNF